MSPSALLGPTRRAARIVGSDQTGLSGSLGPTRRVHLGHLAHQVCWAHSDRLACLTRWARSGRRTHLGHQVRLFCWARLDRHTCSGRWARFVCRARLGHLGHHTHKNKIFHFLTFS